MLNKNNTFGQVAFSGSRFIFWSLAPLLLVTGMALPFLIGEWDLTKVIVCGACSACCLLLVPALYNSRKYWWAARGVTGLIFLSYGWFIVDKLFFSEEGFGLAGSLSESNTRDAILGFMVIGLPCLWYTVFGRFGPRSATESWEEFEDDAE
jgi:hypothetical protein